MAHFRRNGTILGEKRAKQKRISLFCLFLGRFFQAFCPPPSDPGADWILGGIKGRSRGKGGKKFSASSWIRRIGIGNVPRGTYRKTQLLKK
jgi:hypothetical protein